MLKTSKTISTIVLFGVFQSYFPTAIASEGSDEENILESMSLSDLLNIGFRQSLIKARENKKQAVGSLDSIVAEDIADFPDLNLAESIQRMPGVAITREGGEGRQISLRGIGANFTQVQMNGMEILATSSSPMDSRNALQRVKFFDYNIFASEMISQIDIHKSYAATHDEGGIGGIVGLTTPKPFDHDGFKSAISGNIGQNEYTDDNSPRLTAFVTNRSDSFGILASVTYSKRDTLERGFNTFRWRQRTVDAENIGAGVDATTSQLLQDGDIWFARGNRYSVWENTQERIGLSSTLQFKPNDDTMMSLDLVHSQLNNDRYERHLSTSGSSSTALGSVDALEYQNTGGDLEAIYGEFSDVTLRTESRADIADTEFNQLVWTTEWQQSENLKATALIGMAESEFNQPELDKAYLQTIDGVSIITDYRGSKRFDPSVTYLNNANLDTNNWEFRELDLRENYGSHNFENVKFDFEYTFNDTDSLDFGLSYKTYENDYKEYRVNNLVRSEDVPQNGDNLSIDGLYVIYREHPDADWLAANVDASQNFYGVDDNIKADENFQEGRSNTVSEDTLGAYLQYNTEGELFGKPFRANAGLRGYQTDAEWKGSVSDVPVSLDGSYSGILPAFNYVTELSEEFLIRFSMSQNITRPDLEDSAVGTSVDTGDASVSIANPELEPIESNNLEVTFEWYFDEVGYMAVGLFQKRLDGFPVQETTSETYGSLGLPVSLLADGQDENTVFDVTRETNSDDTKVQGIELSFQRDLNFLPEPFDKFGFICNVTYVDGDALYDNVQDSGESQKKPIIGLSKSSGNFTLYYEKDNWGGRIASSYRDTYISRVESGLGDEDERGFHSTLNVDFSAFYAFSDNLKLTVEGINLTDEKEEQYSDSNDRPYNITTSGTTYYLGLTYKI